jgi:diguanylate cyclase (GGDEF)-like protein
MSVFLRIDINIAALVLLGILYFIASRRLDSQDMLSKAFLRASLIILLELFFETCTCVINKRPELWLIPVSVVLHVLLFVAGPVLTYLWYTLVKNMIVSERQGLTWADKILLIPAWLNAVLTLLSPQYKLYFFIDGSNIYHRGEIFWLFSVITYFYFLYGSLLIFKSRRKLVRQEFILLHVFSILPMIGGLVQTLFYGPLLMWSSTAFSLVIFFIFLQQRMVQLDDLTGAWNRSAFESYMLKNIKQNGSAKSGIIYVDIDGLKIINDEYGHVEGDFALKTTIRIIRNAIRKNDLVVRMGGDEFIIILNCATEEVLETTTSRIEASLMEYNKRAGKSYKLACSFGADVFNSDFKNFEQFLDHIDSLMYENKRMKKHRTT